MRRSALLLVTLAAAGCGSNADMQPIVIDLTQKNPTPAPSPSPVAAPPAAIPPEPRTAAPPSPPTPGSAPTPAAAGRPAMPAGGTPEAVVDAQLAAFNRRDLEAFLGFFAADAKLYEYPGRLTQAGLEQIRQLYARRFSESRDLHATISQRIVQGNFVVDHDELAGVPGGPRRAIVIHQVEAGRIVNVWFIH